MANTKKTVKKQPSKGKIEISDSNNVTIFMACGTALMLFFDFGEDATNTFMSCAGCLLFFIASIMGVIANKKDNHQGGMLLYIIFAILPVIYIALKITQVL